MGGEGAEEGEFPQVRGRMTRRGYKEPGRWVRIAGYGIALVLGGSEKGFPFWGDPKVTSLADQSARGSVLASG